MCNTKLRVAETKLLQQVRKYCTLNKSGAVTLHPTHNTSPGKLIPNTGGRLGPVESSEDL